MLIEASQKDSKDGSSTPAPAGTLIPTNLVLVSTLDGSIRGIDRFQGDVHWTLKGGPGSSLIKSNSNFETHKLYRPGPTTERQDSEDEETNPLFLDTLNDIMTDNEDSDDDFNLQESWEDSEVEDPDIYYIIEPQEGGVLYLYGDGRPLEKLPFSVKEIVDNSPFRTPDGTTYIGRKNTLMIEIDPRNGKILQQIDLNKVDNQYRMATTQSQYSARTIFLGRNEYKVTIYDDHYKKLWNVTYSEYVPNKLDWDLPASTVPSDIYIAPDATRAITGINVQNGNLMWTRDLPYPVVNVFDVYRREDYSFALTKQDPPKTLSKGDVGDMLSMIFRKHEIATAYVGVHEGSLYALSTKNYPLVQISQWASMYTGRRPGDTSQLIEDGTNHSNKTTHSFEWTQKPHEMCCHGCEYHIDCMIGQHVVQSVMDDMDDEDHPLYHHSKLYLPPSTPTSTATSSGATGTALSSLPHYTHLENLEDYVEPKSGFFHDGFGKFWKSYILVSSVIVYVYRDRVQTFYQVKVLPRWKQMLKKRAKAKKTKARIAAAAKAEKEKINRERADSLTSLDSFDVDGYIKERMEESKREKEAAVLAIVERRLKEEREREKQEREKQEKEREKKEEEERLKRAAQQQLIVKKQSTGLDLESFKQSKSRVLEISENVLGYGSHGTVVYKGSFDGRAVAVKRLLLDFYDVALKEVKLLQESDDHPNVVRYFYKEESDRFLYIALELCFGSLNDYMERTLSIPEMQLCDAMNPANILSQFTCGLQYLHSLKIVHRDIKPHNILLAPSKNRFVKDAPQMRVLISDFGLCKKLDGEQSSFNYTAASPAGTSGWRAPELLAGALAATSSDTSFSSTRDSISDPNTMVGHVKATRAIDIFSAGCVFYYVLSGGDHPFGNRFGRENNILNGDFDLSKLDSMGEDGVEAKDLVERMISANPKSRPNADTILSHPFFWSTSKRLTFLQDASDRFEIEERDPPSPLLQELESDAPKVIGVDWYKRIDRVVANDLGKFRKYDGKRVRDLLRALRNKKHHWQDLPDAVKKVYGEPPNQFLYYFTARFPHLLLHTYYVVASQPSLKKEGSLGQYF
ncbi:uncharacterized protein B0P05DRAFT_588497 [Gilbertella persicaria]|uniref:uncharacterized protein n=1 Tax=Gilbertella persicaria TaxID=101096 RepID=UPI002220E380|nr:uncharacterized protein B0P05DRAFT_588497 [Gilbertella persicaria]KAI8075463.1 hypothetical protein B0P05DRAFT_588497 [Gilbertella persicaria]